MNTMKTFLHGMQILCTAMILGNSCEKVGVTLTPELPVDSGEVSALTQITMQRIALTTSADDSAKFYRIAALRLTAHTDSGTYQTEPTPCNTSNLHVLLPTSVRYRYLHTISNDIGMCSMCLPDAFLSANLSNAQCIIADTIIAYDAQSNRIGIFCMKTADAICRARMIYTDIEAYANGVTNTTVRENGITSYRFHNALFKRGWNIWYRHKNDITIENSTNNEPTKKWQDTIWTNDNPPVVRDIAKWYFYAD